VNIPPLEDIPFKYRVLLTFALIVIILLLLALAGTAGPRPEPDLYAGVPLDQKLLELDKRALDEAYHTQVVFLFGVWLKGGEADDGRRFATGMRIARRAYALAAQEIEKREQQQK